MLWPPPGEVRCGRVNVWTVFRIRVPSCNGLLNTAVVRMVEVTGSILSVARGLCMSGLIHYSYIQGDPREPDIFKINSTQLFFK